MQRSRRGPVDPFIVMDVLAAARLDQGLGDTVALGLPALRAGIAALYRHRYGVDLNPDRVVVTAGSSAGSSGAFMAARR